MDPTTQDSDHDGIKDQNEDIDLDGNLDAGETDPTLFDTDGDGLSDKTEQDGWTVCIIREATGEEIEHYTVTSDPREVHSDNDGLSDYEEFQNCTDPEEEDTDGDGLNDYIELNYNVSSSPTGIDGVPPEITFFDSEYALRTETSGPWYDLKITAEYVVKVWVSAGDIFGVDWVAVDLDGVGKDMFYADGKQNVTRQKFEFTLDIQQARNSLFKSVNINITARDVNDNLGYKEEEIPSWAERVFDALLGPLMQLAKLVGEIFSAIYSWVISAAEFMYENVIEPISDTIFGYIGNIYCKWDLLILSIDKLLFGEGGDFKDVWNSTIDFLYAIIEPFYNAFSGLIDVISGIIDFLMKFQEYIYDIIESGIKTIIDKLILLITGNEGDSPDIIAEFILSLMLNQLPQFILEKATPLFVDVATTGIEYVSNALIDEYKEFSKGDDEEFDDTMAGDDDPDLEDDGWYLGKIFDNVIFSLQKLNWNYTRAFINTVSAITGVVTLFGFFISTILFVDGLGTNGLEIKKILELKPGGSIKDALSKFVSKNNWYGRKGNFNWNKLWDVLQLPGVGMVMTLIGGLLKLLTVTYDKMSYFGKKSIDFIGLILGIIGSAVESKTGNPITILISVGVTAVEIQLFKLEWLYHFITTFDGVWNDQ